MAGGVGNDGEVVQVGAHILRPAGPHTPAVHALLYHVRTHGLMGVPAVVGIDPDGRERLLYIAGEVALPPFPTWSLTDRVLVTITKLLHRYHDAASSFPIPADAVWNTELADPTPGPDPVVCHNDVCPENVVFRGASATALIDFDFAAPGRRVWDVAAMARLCAPIETAEDAARHDLLDALTTQIDQRGEFVRRRVEAGQPAFVAMWEATGGQARYDRRQAWFQAERAHFLDTLCRDLPPTP